MASYSVPAGKPGVTDKTLTANTADSITFADEIGGVNILTDGTVKVYVTADGSAPSPGGYQYVIPATGAWTQLNVQPVPNNPSNIQLLCASGSPAYAVSRSS